jgi:branched-chain amino acid transport system ATP-binding protein
MNPLLQLDSVTRRFSGLVAVDDLTMCVHPGTIHAVIGPNGAGKTTLFNLISGLIPATAGTIRFADANATRLQANARAALGMARTFQNIRVFGQMTVLENVLTGLHPRLHANLARIVLRTPSFRAEERAAIARARSALAFVGLAEQEAAPASALSYGDQRRLEIARAMAPEPRLLLLDEPAAGMNPAETSSLATLVRRLRDQGATILLVEHDMGFVMNLVDHVTVLNFGRRIFDGPPNAARRDPSVIEAYLGHKVAARLAQTFT